MKKLFVYSLAILGLSLFGQMPLVERYVDAGIVAFGGDANPDCNASDTASADCKTALNEAGPAGGCGSYPTVKPTNQAYLDVLYELRTTCTKTGCENVTNAKYYGANKCVAHTNPD